MAFNGSVFFNQTAEEQAYLAIDGNNTSCAKTHSELLVVDMNEVSIVTEIYFKLNGMFLKFLVYLHITD